MIVGIQCAVVYNRWQSSGVEWATEYKKIRTSTRKFKCC